MAGKGLIAAAVLCLGLAAPRAWADGLFYTIEYDL